MRWTCSTRNVSTGSASCPATAISARLASRIREAGLIVYGFGETKTPKPFVSACDKFIYTEVLVGTDDDEEQTMPPPRSANELRGDARLMNLLRNAVTAASDEHGWAALGGVGGILSKRTPDFDSRNYGYPKLSGLIHGIGLFDVEERQFGNAKHLYVRLKSKGR